jgi:hypothetical protein
LLAMAGVLIGVRERRDGTPFARTVAFFIASFFSLAVLFWPYMIPYQVTVADAAAPDKSLSFLFWGAGVFVLPVIAIYTAVVYWVFRGKLPRTTAMAVRHVHLCLRIRRALSGRHRVRTRISASARTAMGRRRCPGLRPRRALPD